VISNTPYLLILLIRDESDFVLYPGGGGAVVRYIKYTGLAAYLHLESRGLRTRGF
jgi:hypothetical protein